MFRHAVEYKKHGPGKEKHILISSTFKKVCQLVNKTEILEDRSMQRF